MVSSVWPVLSLDGVLVLGVLVRLATILYLFLFSPVCGTGVGFSISARDNSNFPHFPLYHPNHLSIHLLGHLRTLGRRFQALFQPLFQVLETTQRNRTRFPIYHPN